MPARRRPAGRRVQFPEPAPPARENRLWYQYYFHTERGRAGLAASRGEFCKLLWLLWSPNWHFDDATFERSAKAFDNPDHVAAMEDHGIGAIDLVVVNLYPFRETVASGAGRCPASGLPGGSARGAAPATSKASKSFLTTAWRWF